MEKETKDYLEQSSAKLATKEEIKNLRGEMKGEIQNLRGEMKEEIRNLREEMATKEEIKNLRGEIKEETKNLREEMKGLEDRVLHQYHLTAEALRDDIEQVAEGVMNLNEKFGREISQFRKEVAFSHEELKSMINSHIQNLIDA